MSTTDLVDSFGRLGPVQSIAAALVVVAIIAAVAWVLVRFMDNL